MSDSVKRACGDCQLCCKLVPVRELSKGAGQRCQYQKHRKGCSVYHTPRMPPACGLWNCRWLVSDDTADLPRPDRAHYVIDLVPDFVTLQQGDAQPLNLQVVQIWCDPDFPDAHRDPALRRYIERRAKEGIGALVRYNAKDALAIFAPALAADGQWHEKADGTATGEHSLHDVERALGSRMRMVVSDE
jgi:hypothetical protein